MRKIEQVYREILYQAMEKGKGKMTQFELSKELGISLSVVNIALKRLNEIGAVKIEKMGFRIINLSKILYLWASLRNLQKEILYKTRVEDNVRNIERNMPGVVYGAYSAYKLKFNDVPADYSEIYVYANDINEIKKRFPKKEGRENLFVMKCDENLDKYGKKGSDAMIFVDLWNLKEWYASDFLKAIEQKINIRRLKNG